MVYLHQLIIHPCTSFPSSLSSILVKDFVDGEPILLENSTIAGETNGICFKGDLGSNPGFVTYLKRS